MSDYLHECLDRHGDVTRALYGRAQDLREVERRSSRIIESGRLTYDFARIDARHAHPRRSARDQGSVGAVGEDPK